MKLERAAVLLAASIAPPAAAAAEPSAAIPSTTSIEATSAAPAPEVLATRLRALRREPGGTAHFMASLGLGKGLRLNNPYRLQTQLGDDAASVSLTATYVDVGLGAALGPADGIHHGLALHLGGAVEGVSQAYATPTYLATLRPDPRWMVLGRLGPTVLLSPDPNVGGEVAVGGVWFATAGLGVSTELLFDVFYGAATLDDTASVHPIVSLQIALVLDAEVLP
jgi:hypothetical protein